MSGISGIYNVEKQIPDKAEIMKIVKENLIRGKDYIEVYTEDHIGLGFNALNVTPESIKEKQPFVKEGIAIVADVRLDHREELVNSLQLKGFKSSVSEPDINLLWKCYRVWGVDFPKFIYGEFAFVIWDSNIKQIVCGRDVLGSKPFFYKWNGKKLEFSSMLEGLVNNLHVIQWNREYFIEYIANQGFVKSQKTPYQGIMKLPAASILILNGNQQKVIQYWNIKDIKNIKYSNKNEYADHFKELFFQSVKNCMRSNFPVSVAMSGGLDSTSIFSAGCTINPELTRKDFFPVSLVFDKYPTDDERKYIKFISEKYKIDPYEIPADELWSFKNFPYDAPVTAEPYVNIATFSVQHSMYLKAKEANAKVLLTGSGGDEVLSGSNSVIADYMWNLQLTKVIRDVKRLSQIREEPFFSNIIKYGISPLFKQKKTSLNSWVSREIESIIDEQTIERGRIARSKQERQITSIITPLMDQFMAAPLGMEVRHPFLERKLIEYLIAIPMEQKLQGSVKKLILKDAMKGIVPQQVLNRIDKTSHFNIIYKGLQNEWSEMSKGYKRGYLADMGLVNQEGFMKDLNAWRQGDTTNVDYLWTIATLELWFYRLERNKPNFQVMDN
ncbi:asparagine synthase-related protein [Bacillus thuringiensis]|uniref:asparagine synthase-related protein n=1 Tax=Bacillus thuringiensis TaxID=1428 RepID=UPI000CD91244|nr:asparagine synthase-related protein [Bacillus thuringiensis]MCU4930821.1 asparagine synthase-related protein [Bacillus cereus]QFQ28803.1 asparagine synthetase B [Bacillus thuringiensis]